MLKKKELTVSWIYNKALNVNKATFNIDEGQLKEKIKSIYAKTIS